MIKRCRVGLLWGMLLLGVLFAVPESSSQPNILVAIADDASWFHWRQYADASSRFVQTPVFDRVAQDGVLFSNCYTPNPKCAPSRACFLTGRNSWQLEEAANHCSLFPSKFAVYPDLLENEGYHVGYTGKGWAPGNWADGGFLRNPAGPAYNQYKLTPPTTGLSKLDYVKNFETFLAERDANQPFCFWFGAMEPHRPYEFGSGLKQGKKLEDATVLPFWPDNETVRTDLLDYALEIEYFDQQLGRFLAVLQRAGELENTLVIVTADNGMSFPRCKGNVYEAGVHLPLAVMWPRRVPGGRRVDDFISFRDFAPTFLAAAGLEPSSGMSGKSFLPQLLTDQSGQVDPARNACLLGRESHDGISYPVRAIKQETFLYIRNEQPQAAGDGPLEVAYHAGYNSGWILTYPTDLEVLKARDQGDRTYYDRDIGPRRSELLYDLSKDPNCLANLADNPEYAPLKSRMVQKMERELREDQDPRVLGNGAIFETYPYVTKNKPGGK